MTAVLLAVGTTIGVILSSLSNGLKSVASGVGNDFKELGKTIARSVFRTAGEVISFLGKNAWLLILAAAAFLIERVGKRS